MQTLGLCFLLCVSAALGELSAVEDLSSPGFDAIVFVNNLTGSESGEFDSIVQALSSYSQVHPLAFKERCVVPFPENPSKRIINAPTGALDRDYDDSRRIYDAAKGGIKKAIELGFRSPLLVLGPLTSAPTDAVWMEGIFPQLNAIMGALSALYTPLELKEAFPGRTAKYDKLGVYKPGSEVLRLAWAMEEGRRVARDICGSDPERMSAYRIVEYLEQVFGNDSQVSMKAERVDPVKYPFCAAVNRAAKGVERHDGRIVTMEYQGAGAPQETLLLTGKGITFDSGGANIKIKNFMQGMHRDKCGAAAVAGFFKTLSMLKPSSLKVMGFMAFVRNSPGADAYIPDEILTSLAGRRVRVVNTDAEGRVVLTDMLYYAKEAALKETNPHIFSIATLTGHAQSTYLVYTALMDNGPARRKKTAASIQKAGDRISDMMEISTIRREDYDITNGQSEYEDLMQSFHLNPSEHARGHQFPAAYLIRASGLDEHGLNSPRPIPYTHVDICPARGRDTEPPTGVPIMALTVRYVLPRLGVTEETATCACSA
ncbi:metalloexopeptidase activity [Sparganum proliferum]